MPEVGKVIAETSKEISKNVSENVKNVNIERRVDAIYKNQPERILPKINIESRIESIDKLKDQYVNELIEKSPCKETIEKKDLLKNLTDIYVVNPEDVEIARKEFNLNKKDIIREWEKHYNMEWPTYKKDDIDPKTGNVLREIGQRYDAHHKRPLKLGGENTWENITPLKASEHNDSRFIHRENGPLSKILALS